MRAGELWVTRTDAGPVITQADPVILIADEFLREMRAGTLEPGCIAVDGDVITFDAVNQRAVYRLTGARDNYGSWYAEWPD